MGNMREFMNQQKAKKALGEVTPSQPEQAKVTVPLKPPPPQTPQPKNKGAKIPPKGGSSTAPPKEKRDKPPQPTQPPAQKKKKKNNFWRPTCPLCQELGVKHRLPVGSKFTSEYVSDGLWKGTLTVPGLPEFSAEAVGTVKLNQLLDHQWQDVAFKPGERPHELADNIKKMRQKKHEERQRLEHEAAVKRKEAEKSGVQETIQIMDKPIPINEPLNEK